MERLKLKYQDALRALVTFKSIIRENYSVIIRDATIQRFEYTYELSWKTLKRYLALESGIEEFNIKNLYREAGRQNILDNITHWFQYHTARNMTSHTYNENVADETYDLARAFLVDAEKLVEKLEKLCANSP